MSRTCQVTGATPGFGHHVSHSLPSLNRHVALTVSARGITTIDHRGIERVVADIVARGGRI